MATQLSGPGINNGQIGQSAGIRPYKLDLVYSDNAVTGATAEAEFLSAKSKRGNNTATAEEGDWFYNGTDNAIQFYNGSAWVVLAAGAGNFSGDVTATDAGVVTISAGAVESSMLEESVLRKASTTLSSAQIKALNTTGIEVVAAPGAGKALVFVSGSVQHVYGTADYATSHNVTFNYVDESGTACSGTIADVFISGSAVDKFGTAAPAGVSLASASIVNQPIVVTASANPTTGDGTGVATVWYRVVTLA